MKKRNTGGRAPSARKRGRGRRRSRRSSTTVSNTSRGIIPTPTEAEALERYQKDRRFRMLVHNNHFWTWVGLLGLKPPRPGKE